MNINDRLITILGVTDQQTIDDIKKLMHEYTNKVIGSNEYVIDEDIMVRLDDNDWDRFTRNRHRDVMRQKNDQLIGKK